VKLTDTATESPKAVADRYYDDRQTFPFLEVLKKNHDVLVSELLALSEEDWEDWPEKEIYTKKDTWQVYPFLGLGKWFDHNGAKCPETYRILKTLPGLRTATYSRMGSKTALKPHQGWGELSNNVLRCHYGLVIPEGSGVWVDGNVTFHRTGGIVVFDDSKPHSGFNHSETIRVVLLMDIARPIWVPKGTSDQEFTGKLIDLVDALS
jgi:beta-hydroxylase